MQKKLLFYLIMLTLCKTYATPHDTHQKNKCLKTLQLLQNLTIVSQLRKSRGNAIKVDFDFMLPHGVIAVLKEMIILDGRVTKKGGKPHAITNNGYTRSVFKYLFRQVSQNQKNILFDYALDKTSFDMLKFLVELGAQMYVLPVSEKQMNTHFFTHHRYGFNLR